MSNPLIICSGFHDPDWTRQWLIGMDLNQSQVRCFPPSEPIYSPKAVLQFCQAWCKLTQPLVVVAYSAGNVGGLGAAIQWQKRGGTVARFVAVDPWGVPLVANFPVITLSHDACTDFYCQAWGIRDRFVAIPPVGHQQLWQFPQSAWGLGIVQGKPQRQTARTFIHKFLESC